MGKRQPEAKNYEGKNEYHLLLKLPHELLDDIDIMARRDGVSRSAWIRNAAAAVLNSRKKELEATRAFFEPPAKQKRKNSTHPKPPARQEEAPEEAQPARGSVARALDMYTYLVSREGRTATGYVPEYDASDARRDFLATCLQTNSTARLIWIALAEACHLCADELEHGADDAGRALQTGLRRASNAPGHAALMKRHAARVDPAAQKAAQIIAWTALSAGGVKDRAGALKVLETMGDKLVNLVGVDGVPDVAEFAGMK